MFVLSRTVCVRNSLLITVEGEMFSLVKISGKLYKSCMCLILSQSCRCLYIALSLSVSACSCVRTSSSVRFADVRRITTRADEFINNI